MPDGITDRQGDVWEALLAVADMAGGHWPRTARVAAVTLVTASKANKPSLGVTLLHDIRCAFNLIGQDKVQTADILAELNKIDESPWATIRKGEGLDARGLANRLGKYGIGSKPLRVADGVIKGYSRAQFEDAWNRYLEDDTPQTPDDSSVTAVTADTNSANETDVTDVTQLNGHALTEGTHHA